MPVFLQSKSTDSALLNNQSEQEAVESSTNIQPKLTIRAADDPYEKEADAVADKVIRMPDPKVQRQAESEEEEPIQTRSITPLVQRQPEPEEEEEEAVPEREEESTPILESVPTGDADELDEEEDFLQAKATQGYTPQVTPNVAADIQSLRGGGLPLPPNQRHFFESRMGQDFSGVRIHTDSKAADTAQTIQAKAFTLGNNIVFNTGQYSHDNQEGKKLLAHELTHVVQQGDLGHRALQRSPGPVNSASYEIDCYEPETISRFSDKKLIREITRVRTVINRGFKGYCQTEAGTIKAPWQYYRDLDIEATGRGLLTHPTGITRTTAGKNLDYGANFTHTLKISAGGSSSDLKGSEVKEDLSVARDDFHFNQKIKEAKWVLGKMKVASPAPGKFTDQNFTPAYIVRNKCVNSFVAIPPVRVEVQKFKWRRVSTDNWDPPFYTNKIIFKLVRDRRGLYWAITINNGVVHKERYHGGDPPRLKP